MSTAVGYICWLTITALITALVGWLQSPAEKDAEVKYAWFGSLMKIFAGLGIDVPKILEGVSELLAPIFKVKK